MQRRVCAIPGCRLRADKAEKVTIAFYKNGFVLGTNPALEKYDDPANAALLADMDKG